MGITLDVTGNSNSFDNCEINGNTRVTGKGNKFFNTVFLRFNAQPVWVRIIEVIASLATIITMIFAVLQFLHK